ncbi:hypothetical protein AAFF_G00298860 [Aldrovandia affinis]|uniref:Uncharacterized protein n=1 Tax=Aldrovandia affinis TaxID=143900 RepID=A0AAD7R8J6_9TELE|nr:hypothetical protein AAFF_G00298860 [Aldrovandia affinis]
MKCGSPGESPSQTGSETVFDHTLTHANKILFHWINRFGLVVKRGMWYFLCVAQQEICHSKQHHTRRTAPEPEASYAQGQYEHATVSQWS